MHLILNQAVHRLLPASHNNGCRWQNGAGWGTPTGGSVLPPAAYSNFYPGVPVENS